MIDRGRRGFIGNQCYGKALGNVFILRSHIRGRKSCVYKKHGMSKVIIWNLI